MQIIEIKLSEIKPYKNNPRNNDEAVGIVAKSIEEFGFKVPMVIDSAFNIITGHTRYKAAERLNLETVPCIMADDLTEDQIKAFRLADNKTSEYATWDFEKLNEELEALMASGFDIESFGFELDFKDPEENNFDFEEAVAQVKVPITKPGTVWQLGRHRLMCGDSTKQADLQILMDTRKADLVITDPPYNVNYQSVTTDMKIMNDKMKNEPFRQFLFDAYTAMREAMKAGAAFYVFHADTEGYNFRGALVDAGLKLSQNLVWVKNGLVPGRSDYQWKHEPILYGWKEGAAHKFYGDRTQTSVQEDLLVMNPKKMKKEELVEFIKRMQEAQELGSTVIHHDKTVFNDDHPTMKPVKLIGRLLFNSSTKGDLVLDSFGGSGSTLMACEQTGRDCYTMELDPIYCDVIVRRYEEFTKQKAVAVGGKVPDTRSVL